MQTPDMQHLPEDSSVITILLIVLAYVFPTIQDVAYFFAIVVSLGTILVNWDTYVTKIKRLTTKIKAFFTKLKK